MTIEHTVSWEGVEEEGVEGGGGGGGRGGRGGGGGRREEGGRRRKRKEEEELVISELNITCFFPDFQTTILKPWSKNVKIASITLTSKLIQLQ